MRRYIFACCVAVLIGAACADAIEQPSAIGGSVVGTASGGHLRTVGVAGQAVSGFASGNVGSGGGFPLLYPNIRQEPSAADVLLPVPLEFRFDQNYPNPFNPTTIFTFELPRNARVRLVVHNILGREVAVVADGFYTAGAHRIAFHAPPQLASGLYIASFEAGEFHRVRKMVLLK